MIDPKKFYGCTYCGLAMKGIQVEVVQVPVVMHAKSKFRKFKTVDECPRHKPATRGPAVIEITEEEYEENPNKQ